MLENPVTGTLNSFNANPTGFFGRLVSVLITGALVVAILFFFFNLVLGGIGWINSAGDKGKLETSRQRVLNALIGVIIVLLSFAIIGFVQAVFGVSLTVFDLSSLQI